MLADLAAEMKKGCEYPADNDWTWPRTYAMPRQPLPDEEAEEENAAPLSSEERAEEPQKEHVVVARNNAAEAPFRAPATPAEAVEVAMSVAAPGTIPALEVLAPPEPHKPGSAKAKLVV